MKNLLHCFLAICLLSPAQAQNWTWADNAGGILPDEANGCTIDNAGNMYMSGFYFSTDINFGNGNSLSNNGLSDGFIVKYDANGSTQWASKVKGPLEDKATKCAVDYLGNVIVTGYFDSPSIQFGGNNDHNVSNFDGSGATFDCFIVKYSASGTPLWFRAIGKADDDGGSSVATDSTGNIFVTGWFRAPSITAGGFTLFNKNPAGGSSDMFLIKYDPNGTVLWAKNAGSQDDDKGRGCIVDPSGNVIVTGYYKGDSIDIEGNYFPNNGSKDTFVAKYGPDGTLLAAKGYGGSGGEEGFSCSADAEGNVFIAGNYSSNPVTFDTVSLNNTGSGSGAFVLKLDPSLDALWANGGSSSSTDETRGCSTDMYGNTVITGVFNGPSITFGTTVLENNGGDEIFLVKYDPDGNMFWAKKAGKSNDDGSNDCFIDNNGRVLIAGYFNSGSIRFGNIDMDNSYFLVATSDVFIAHTCYASMGTDIQTGCNAFTWIDGTTYTASNNNAVYNFPAGSANSCDSLVRLDLTMNTVDTGVTTMPGSLTAINAAATYRWLDCDNSFAYLPTETAQSFTATANGNYAVELTENACVDTSACYFINNIVTGVMDSGWNNSLKVYPNPTNGQLYIELGKAHTQVSVTVRNVLGQTLLSNNYNNRESALLHLPGKQGVYFIEARTGDGSVGVAMVLKR